MSDENLFETNEQPANFFDQLVGDGKKYRDNEALAKAAIEKDKFIEKLQQENAEARAELKARLNLEEIADRVSRQTSTVAQPTTPRQEPGEHPTKEPEDLSDRVRKLLNEERAKENRTANYQKTREQLENLYGSDYKQALIKAAKELEVSENYLNDLAGSSPKGFIQLIQSVVKPDDPRPVNPPSSSFEPLRQGTDTTRKNAAYYSQLRKDNPNLYFSKRVQIEMHKEATRQGDAFYQ